MCIGDTSLFVRSQFNCMLLIVILNHRHSNFVLHLLVHPVSASLGRSPKPFSLLLWESLAPLRLHALTCSLEVDMYSSCIPWFLFYHIFTPHRVLPVPLLMLRGNSFTYCGMTFDLQRRAPRELHMSPKIYPQGGQFSSIGSRILEIPSKKQDSWVRF